MNKRWFAFAAAAALLLGALARVHAEDPRTLSNDDLIALERNADDAKYKPVYEALLVRKGIDKKYREEAVDALAKLDHSDAATEILRGIPGVDASDAATVRDLAGLLTAQKPETLKLQREKLVSLAQMSPTPLPRQAAFAAIAVADGKPDDAWQLASKTDGGTQSLLVGIPLIPDAAARGAFYPLVFPLVAKAPDTATQIAAVAAAGFIPGHEADTFKALTELVRAGDAPVRDAAVRSVARIPSSKWPADQVETLAQAVVKLVGSASADQRATLPMTEAVQLGNDLAAALPAAQGNPIRKSLRASAGNVVVIHTIRDQMMYDVHYFVVQAGQPVRIVLENEDWMPHNVLVGAPNSVQAIGMMTGAMKLPEDPKEKAYVPASSKVLQSMMLVQPGESGTLSFDAPTKPGEYAFLCSFPNHWPKMYGVMDVVPDIDKYDESPTPPKDPLTRRPYQQQKVEQQ